MEGETSQATVHGVAKSRTRLSNFILFSTFLYLIPPDVKLHCLFEFFCFSVVLLYHIFIKLSPRVSFAVSHTFAKLCCHLYLS